MSWRHHDPLDPARVGMFGFSAGGFTALVMIGGVPDMTRVAPYCTEHPEEWACRRLKGTRTPQEPDAFVHDPRIAAAVIAAPAIGYSFTPKGLANIQAPIQLWRGDSDEIYRTRAMPRIYTTGCRQSPSITWCQTPAILLSWRRAPRRLNALRRRSAATPRVSIVRLSIASSMPPWWTSSKRSSAYDNRPPEQ